MTLSLARSLQLPTILSVKNLLTSSVNIPGHSFAPSLHVMSCHVTGERRSTPPSAVLVEEAIECEEDMPQLSLPQAEQTRGHQRLLLNLALEITHHLGRPLRDTVMSLMLLNGNDIN